MPKQRMVSFRNQRVGWTLVIFTVVFAFTSSVLWGHIDNIVTDATYQRLAKAGLLLLPLVALMMTIWELFVDDDESARVHQSHITVRRLKNFCFYGAIGLALAEVIHAGGILTFESSTAQQHATIAAVGDAQAKIAAAQTGAAIEAAGRQAQEMNARGQRQTARRTIQGGSQIATRAGETAQRTVAETAATVKSSSFLPDWYVGGGMYVALPALALIMFGATMIFARKAAPYVDKDDDGKPDNPFPKELEVDNETFR